MSVEHEFRKTSKRIEACLSAFFAIRRPELRAVNAWGDDLLNRVPPFILGGKMIRGGLILLSHDLLHGSARREAIKAAAAMELFHSAFLIHDDIMDDDPIRRGMPSFHIQYQTQAEKEGLSDPSGFGRAAALCAGDILLFMGNELLASLKVPSAIKTEVLILFARVLAQVGPAQIQDLYFAKSRFDVDREDIFRLYTFKTARYTFSLPLMAGARLAGAGPKTVRNLAEIGSDLGLIFQIKDDEIGQFGDKNDIGKPVGSDVGEGKKTLYYLFLKQALEEGEQPEALAAFGRRRPSAKTIAALNDLLRSKKIPERVEAEVRRISQRCEQRIHISRLPPGLKIALNELLTKGRDRTR